MDLIGSIINWFSVGTTPEAGALRALVPSGAMIADWDYSETPLPYVIASEHAFTNVIESTSLSTRIQSMVVQFTAYAQQRGQVAALLDALEACYVHKPDLVIDHLQQLASPRVLDRQTFRTTDNFYGVLNLEYLLNKSPQ